MRYIVLTSVMAIALSLCGCSSTFEGSKKAYLKGSESSLPTHNTSSAVLKREKQYYPAGTISPGKNHRVPLLVPPGENFSKLKAEKKRGRLQVTQQGSTILVSLPLADAWRRVARALKRTPYSVMDRDRSLHTYYVVDRVSTHNQITRTTPIYRLTMKAKSSVVTAVRLTGPKGQSIATATSDRVLKALRKALT